MVIVQLLSSVILEATDTFGIARSVLYIAGLWMIFKKCGLPGWQALIPGYRYYALAQCASRELEGRVLFLINIITAGIGAALVFIPDTSSIDLFLTVLLFMIALVDLIYTIRVYVGLLEVFGAKKRWLLLWLIADFIPAMFWGISSRYQPRWKVEDIKSEIASFFSGSRAAVLDEGLTINLEERSVRDFFKKKYLLRDLHMYIKPGSLVLLLGGSGSGKSTLLNAINGYEKAKADITLNGGNVYREYKKMQYEVGFVPQQDLMRGNDTVLRTLMDAATLRLPADFSREDRRKRVDDVMKIFGLTPVQSSLVDKLSGGQRKRLSIAMEFISNPALFILDEPDSGLDGVMARELMEQLRAIADQGKIVIVITHTPDRVVDLFDSVIVLAKDSMRTGRLAFFGSIEQAKAFFDKERMEQIVMSINRQEEGGEGRADEFIMKYAEAQHG